MKIAVWHNLRSGGGKRALYDHVKGLVERGHVVECWCPPTADASYLPLSRIAVEHVRPLALPSPPKRALSPALAHARLLLRRLRALDDHVRLCAREIESGGFDIVFAGACVFVATPAIARHTTLPSAIYLGEPYRPLYEALPELPWQALPPQSWIAGFDPWNTSYCRMGKPSGVILPCLAPARPATRTKPSRRFDAARGRSRALRPDPAATSCPKTGSRPRGNRGTRPPPSTYA